MKVVCIGDSITYAEHLPREAAWTTHLAVNLGVHVENAGVCGDTTRLGLERFPKDVQEHRPDIVVIQFGLNDCNHWKTDLGLPRVSIEAYEANLVEMVDRSKRFGAQTVVICTPTPVRMEPWYEVSRREYSEAALRASALCLPYTAELGDPEQVLLDEVHLNGYGNQLFADGLASLLGGL